MKKTVLGIAIVMCAVLTGTLPAHATTVADMLVMIEELQARVTTLETQVNAINLTQLEADVAALDAATANLQDLNPYVSVIDGAVKNVSGPNVVLSGVNLHVRNGVQDVPGATLVANGLGNIIIGYNEQVATVPQIPLAIPVPPTDPVTGDVRTGSHMLVLGIENQWAASGGLVAGARSIVGPAALTSGAFGLLRVNQQPGTFVHLERLPQPEEPTAR